MSPNAFEIKTDETAAFVHSVIKDGQERRTHRTVETACCEKNVLYATVGLKRVYRNTRYQDREGKAA